MNSIQIYSDRVARICCKANRFNTLVVVLFLPSLLAINSFAGSATWAPSSGATVGDWNTASNWSPQSVPNGSTDVATFAHSFTTGVSLSAGAEVAVINFASSMFPSAYTITSPTIYPVEGGALYISGAGITNDSGLTQNFVNDVSSSGKTPSVHGEIVFKNGATAGNATVFTNRGGSVNSGSSGFIFFLDNATAANGTFTNNGATAPGASGGKTFFLGNSSASNGTFTNHGATASTAGGGVTLFANNSSAASAILIADAGTNGGTAGEIQFMDDSTGGTSRIVLNGTLDVLLNGTLDISSHHLPGVSVGSIEGNGLVSLGLNNLTVGSNNRSTAFSGMIYASTYSPGGSLTKIGNGKLTLNFPSIYTDGTTINKGMLLVKNTSGSATGSGAVQVNGGTLEGVGTIDGAVTVGTGVGTTSKANLIAGNSATSPGTLTINNPVTFQSDSTYKCVLNRSSGGKASKVTAFGVTINNSAQFAFTQVGTGTLATGTVFRVIDNTSNLAISGRFRNLSNGTVLTSNDGTKFKVNYTGGTGNDLTLKVVP